MPSRSIWSFIVLPMSLRSIPSHMATKASILASSSAPWAWSKASKSVTSEKCPTTRVILSEEPKVRKGNTRINPPWTGVPARRCTACSRRRSIFSFPMASEEAKAA